jgi:hypothetical protein
MPRRYLLPLALLAAPALGAESPPADGRLGTLPIGRYLCELPGDAAGPASLPVADAWFDIVTASSYKSEGGGGTYLLTGREVVFTRGPMKDERFERTSSRTLRRVDHEGRVDKLRCVRTGRAD